MSIYPYKFVLTKNVRQALVPVINAQVYVYKSGTDTLKSLYPTEIEDSGTLLAQPITTDVNGEVQFYTHPGRIRIDSALDDVTTKSLEDVIVDNDMLMMPIFNEQPQGDQAGTTFTLVKSVFGDKISLFVDGALWEYVANNVTPAGAQFTAINNTITTGQAPGTSAVMRVIYVPVPT